MSDERFELVQFKKTSKGKVYATKLGWATKRDDGGFWVNFDALPFGDGACAVVPQRERATPGPTPAVSQRQSDLDDEIPF